MKIYKVSEIGIFMENISDTDGKWLGFKSETISTCGCIRVIELSGKKIWGYHNLMTIDPEVPVRHILRMENDIALCNEDYSYAQILPLQDTHSITAFLMQLFYTHAVRRQMIQLHCATIEDQGRGILFMGPSGIGKTTQAERWAEFRGASIINGDVGFVQRTEREYIAWGTPWHGSSPYCLNASVPVKALVVLKQAPENRLRELTGFEKVSEIAGSVFYPTWLEDGMELCTDTLNHLLTDLPVYRLDNRADRESVEILAKELDRIT